MNVTGMHEAKVESSAVHFDVLVLGPLTVYRDGVPVNTATWQNKVRSLLRILAVAPERRRLRDEIVEILWPEADPDSGPRNLRVVAHMLRKGLGGGDPSPILSERGWIALNPAHEWDLDVDRFEEGVARAVEVADLEEVAGLYRGEPVPEERYADWAIPVRARISRMWRDLCLHLAQIHAAAGRDESALRWLEPVLEEDRTDEEALRELLRCLGRLGRRTEALRRFASFTQALRDDLDLEPGPETLAVVDDIRRRVDESRPAAAGRVDESPSYRPLPVIPAYPLPAQLQLVGRHDALGHILRFLPSLHGASDFGAQPRTVMIEGEPGIGKTRLLAEVAARARRAGMLTLAGAAYREEGELPYGPIHDALGDYIEDQPPEVVRLQLGGVLPDLAWILPEIQTRLEVERRAETEALRLRVFLAVADALERIAQVTPLVLLLDDLHFADEPTLQLLHFLVRQDRLRRILVVGAVSTLLGSSTARLGGLADLMGKEQATTVPLHGLTHEDLSFLLEEAARGKCADRLVTALRIRSRGNPGVALSMLKLARDRGALEEGTQGWQIKEGSYIPLPPEWTGPLLRRLDQLGQGPREVLEIGAVLGRDFAVEPARLAWGSDERAFGAALQSAVEAGLLEERGERYAFTHPLIRETLESGMTRARFATLHLAAAEALARCSPSATGEVASRIAEHFTAAGPAYAEQAATYWMAASGRSGQTMQPGDAIPASPAAGS